MAIRIFALAKELGIESKELIEYCNQAGVQAKNSALASISPEQRDVVLSYIEQKGKPSKWVTLRAVRVLKEAGVTG